MDIRNIKRTETHTHSWYSNLRLIDSINDPEKIIKKVNELGLYGCALTDHECLCGAVDWLNAEKKLKKDKIIPEYFKCILGNEIYLTDNRDKKQPYYHHILIAKDDIGFRQLKEMSSIAWLNSYSYKKMDRVPLLRTELESVVLKQPGHLFSTTACIGGRLGNLVFKLLNPLADEAEKEITLKQIHEFLEWNKNIFGDDFYIEIAPGQSKEQILFNKFIKNFIKENSYKIIIATDAHYLTEKERFIHKTYLNSKDGDREVDSFYHDSHLMSNEEAFSNLEKSGYTEDDFLKLCNSTMEIYNGVVGYNIFHEPIIPKVDIEYYKKKYEMIDCNNYPTLNELYSSENNQERYWVNECINKLHELNLYNEVYLKRLEVEADIINTVGEKINTSLFPYFNTLKHYIPIIWECNSLVEPGRGSSVCFLSNYLLGITQLDPIIENLSMYWRFLNKDRLELPDIDIDISPTQRQKVLARIRKERGQLNVLQICAFGTETTRSAINTSIRALGINNDVAQYLTSLIPQERGFLPSLKEVIYGDESKGKKPIQAFINEASKYEGLIDVALGIEGVVCRRSIHASGVILYNDSPFDTNAIMRSPDGTLTTQFDLHQSEQLGDTKFDFLVTEIVDKLTQCLKFLQRDGYFDKNLTLKELYDKVLHPKSMNLNDDRIWDNLAKANIMDIFQFSTEVGIATAKATKPKTPFDMAISNALIRLSGEKGAERPADRYVRLKNNMKLWYDECKANGFNQDEIKVLEKYYLPTYGCPCSQEHLMLVCMDPNISNFSLAEANAARKVCSKKQIDKVDELHEKFISRCKNQKLGQYVWDTTIKPQMSYAFALPHGLAYSYIGIQTLILATNYPQIYWDAACLVVNSGGVSEDIDDIYEDEIVDIYEEEDDAYDYIDLPNREGKIKRKNKTVNYGKVAKALGDIMSKGIKVSAPDINKSEFTFSPNSADNTIIFGLRGITRVGEDLIKEIINNRPYISIYDFLSKVKVNKPQMINLIKCGAFDAFGDRNDIMKEYITSISDFKKAINLRNLQAIIENNLLPSDFEEQIKYFNFNKYIKKFKNGNYYELDNIAFSAVEKYYPIDKLIPSTTSESGFKLSIDDWKKVWKKQQDKIRPYIQEHEKEFINYFNNMSYNLMFNKYAKGDYSRWEMQSISCYLSGHELENVNNLLYDIVDFNKLSEEPDIESIINIKGKTIPLLKIHRICGTVIDKDKNKRTVTLLTPEGVVILKIYGEAYAFYDRQISDIGNDGKKHIIERSMFERGNMIIACGIRKDDLFICKKYNKTPHHLIERILGVNSNGILTIKRERSVVNQ